MAKSAYSKATFPDKWIEVIIKLSYYLISFFSIWHLKSLICDSTIEDYDDLVASLLVTLKIIQKIPDILLDLDICNVSKASHG